MKNQLLREKMLAAFYELEGRFVHKDSGLLYNYVGLHGEVLLPTEEELLLGKPSHLSWNCPIEDGSYYDGFYLVALIDLAEQTDFPVRPAIKRIVGGLLSLSELPGTPEGYIARNYVGKNKAHYAIGSNDQTFPWFYGLWRYCTSSLPSTEEKKEIISALLRVAKALEGYRWQIPSAPLSLGFRGDYTLGGTHDIVKLLFIQRAMYDLTKEEYWLREYQKSVFSCPEGYGQTRLDLLRNGAGFSMYDGESVYYCLKNGEASEEVFGRKISIIGFPFFTRTMVSIALRALMKMETDETVISAYGEGLQKDVDAAVTHIVRYKGFDIENAPKFSPNWRVMNTIWNEQNTVDESDALARRGMSLWFRECPRFPYENAFVREPLFAGYVVALGQIGQKNRNLTEKLYPLLMHYPWEKLNTSTFYVALCIYGQLLADGAMEE